MAKYLVAERQRKLEKLNKKFWENWSTVLDNKDSFFHAD